jgi:hypothetical protein
MAIPLDSCPSRRRLRDRQVLHAMVGWLDAWKAASVRDEAVLSAVLTEGTCPAFSFVPAFLAGLINTRFKHKAAQFVWVVPAAVLAYKLIVFPVTTSVLARESGTAFHYYFGGEFLIPEYHNWAEFRDIAGSFDMMRGMAQLSFTAPFYAGVGYSLAAWIEIRAELHRGFTEKLRKWEESRFDHRNGGTI